MFPHNMTLAETSQVVARHNETLGAKVFIEAVRGPFTIFNYLIQYPGSFPDLTGDPARDREIGIIRECRGLTFHSDTGEVAARKFHKFFNYLQVEETQLHNLDFSVPHIIMDKLDGSMICAVRNRVTGKFEWHTKMGATPVAEPVEKHVASRPEYEKLADRCEAMNLTPIFEWCSRQQRIVIDYPEDQLVLTHVRHNITGAYAPRDAVRDTAELHGIPTVRVFEHTIDNIDEFVEHTKGLKNLEGYVVHFHQKGNVQHDLMLKLKADDYCMLHNSKEQLNLEKNALAMLLSDEIDDLLPQLDAGDRDAITAFSNAVHEGMASSAREVEELRDRLLSKIDTEADARERKKQYASLVMWYCVDFEVSEMLPFIKGLLFRGFEVEDLLPEIRKIVKGSCGTQTRVDEARVLIGGVKWGNYRGQFDGDL